MNEDTTIPTWFSTNVVTQMLGEAIPVRTRPDHVMSMRSGRD